MRRNDPVVGLGIDHRGRDEFPIYPNRDRLIPAPGEDANRAILRNTLIGAINNLRPNCVAVAVVLDGQTDVAAIERAARRRRLRVLWIAKRGGRTF